MRGERFSRQETFSLKEKSLWSLTKKLDLHGTIEYCQKLGDICYSIPNFWIRKLGVAYFDEFTTDKYKKYMSPADWFKFAQVIDRDINDEGDDDPTIYFDLIQKLQLTGYVINYVFAAYMNDNSLDDATLEEFISLGVDINVVNDNYNTDQNKDNALSFAAE